MTDVGLEALGLWTMQQAADWLGVSLKTVKRLIERGELTKLRPGAGWLVRIDPAEVIAYKQRLKDQAAKSA